MRTRSTGSGPVARPACRLARSAPSRTYDTSHPPARRARSVRLQPAARPAFTSDADGAPAAWLGRPTHKRRLAERTTHGNDAGSALQVGYERRATIRPGGGA